MLAPRTVAPVLPARGATNVAPIARGSLLRVNADRAKVTREYREDDGQLVEAPKPPASQPPSGGQQPIYADQVMQSMPKPKDNMSKDMKAKLRQEYLGWGGSANTAMSNNYFLWIIVIISALAVASSLTGAL